VIRASLGTDGKFGQVDSERFTITISDPCDSTTFVTQSVQNLSTTVKGSADEQSFDAYTT
jgi:hypothetical protein